MKKNLGDLDPELVKDGVELLRSGQATYFVYVGEEPVEVTDEVTSSLDAAAFALVRAGVEIHKAEQGAAFLLSLAIDREAAKQQNDSVDSQG